MLDQAILRRTIEPDGSGSLDAIADLLIAFYVACQPAEISPSAYVRQFAREHAHQRGRAVRPTFKLDGAQVKRVVARVRRGIEEGALLKDRVKHGRIVEGHGDLRPEHICLSEPPVIIDCLEFSRALRLVDPFDELTFLTLECDFLGAGWIGEHIMERCAEGLNDMFAPRLLEFYWAYRACLRARIALAHLLEPNPRSLENGFRLRGAISQLAQTRDAHAAPSSSSVIEPPAVAAADGFGKERGRRYDLDLPTDHLGLEPKRGHGIGHECHGKIRLADHVTCVADKEAMGGKGEYFSGSVIPASFGGPGERPTCADEIIDHEHCCSLPPHPPKGRR